MSNTYEFTPEYATTYTPSLRILHYTSVDFAYRNSIPKQIHVMQYDKALPVIKVDLYYMDEPYTLETIDCVNARFFKPDATFCYNPVLGTTPDRKSVYVEVTQQMSAAYGTGKCSIEILRGDGVAATAIFDVIIDRNPVQEDAIESTTEFKLLMQYLDEVAEYATAARSYAIGDTSYREGEDTDNAWYYYRLARSWVKGDNGEREGEATDNANWYYNMVRSYTVGDNGFREGEETDNASWYYNMSRSYAVGDSGIREGEENNNAKFYAEMAQYYFDQFHENVTESEAWAVGERDGTPVDSDDKTYHNNSKYYAEVSEYYYDNTDNIAEELDRKLGLVEFDVDDDGYLIYTDNSAFDFVVDDEGMLLWEVNY